MVKKKINNRKKKNKKEIKQVKTKAKQKKEFNRKVMFFGILFLIGVFVLIFFKFVSLYSKPINVLSPMVVDCEKNGGEYVIITNDDGSQSGVCKLPDGTNCTDEKYYQGIGCFEEQLNWHTCDEFKDITNCTSEVNVVCARTITNTGVVWLDYTNACIACKTKSNLINVTHYIEGACPLSQ